MRWLCLLLWLPLGFSCKSGPDREKRADEKAAPSPELPLAPVKAPQPNTSPTAQEKHSGQSPVRLPGVMHSADWLADASRVVAYGERDNAIIVAAGVGWLRWFSATGAPLGERLAEGGVQVLEVVDVDGDGDMEVVLGKGRARGALEAAATLEVLHLGKPTRVESIPLPATTRAQVVAARSIPGSPGQLWVASYVSKFEVEVNRFVRSDARAWTLAESRGLHRVVGDLEVLADGTPVIAQLYGETKGSHGGVYALAGETPLALPSVRGARALLAMPAAGGRATNSLAMADGWHREYGKRAQGLVSVVAESAAPEGWQQTFRVEVARTYGFTRLRLGDVHATKGLEIVVAGNGAALVVLPGRPDLLYELAGRSAQDAFPVDLDGDTRMEVVIVGPEPAIWRAR